MARIRIACALTCFLFGFVPNRVLAQNHLAQARAGNKSAIEAIQTLSCKVKVIYGNGFESLNETGEYWRLDDTVRVRGRKGTVEFECFQQGSVVRAIATKSVFADGKLQVPASSARERIGSIIPAVGHPLTGCNVWELALFCFTGPISEPGSVYKMLAFDQLMAEPHSSNGVQRRIEEETEYVVVSYSHPGARVRYDYEIWLNPQLNYLATKLVTKEINNKSGKVSSARAQRILRFTEVVPGIFFPETAESRTLEGKFLRSVIFTGIRINQPLPTELLAFRFPAGIEVFDAIEGKSYKIAPDGNPTGPFEELRPPIPNDRVEALEPIRITSGRL